MAAVSHRSSGTPSGLANPLFQEGGRTRQGRRQLSRSDIGQPSLLSSTMARAHSPVLSLRPEPPQGTPGSPLGWPPQVTPPTSPTRAGNTRGVAQASGSGGSSPAPCPAPVPPGYPGEAVGSLLPPGQAEAAQQTSPGAEEQSAEPRPAGTVPPTDTDTDTFPALSPAKGGPEAAPGQEVTEGAPSSEERHSRVGGTAGEPPCRLHPYLNRRPAPRTLPAVGASVYRASSCALMDSAASRLCRGSRQPGLPKETASGDNASSSLGD